MTTLSGSNESEKLAALSSKTYKEQCIWFLNAFWPQVGHDAAQIWTYKHTFDELDHDKKAAGCALDEVMAHRFLEKHNETLTVQAMRERLRATGAIGAQVRMVPIVHVLIFKYGMDWHHLVNAPQGNKEEVAKAEALLAEVQEAFQESEERDAEAAAALRESQAREREAKRAEDQAIRAEAAAREQEAPFKAAQEEVDAALADVKAQEEYRERRTEELKRKSQEGGVVQQNKAKNELAQHLAEDPLPLRKAKITLEAALKKAEKARAPFEAATREAEAARAAASAAAAEAAKALKKAATAKAAAEAALEEARRRLEEAEAYLEEAKKRLPEGQIWWLERELQEKRKYLPKARGGVDK